jgi:dipeptidyl aminopeptidase/acylaminoacyl peptidase
MRYSATGATLAEVEVRVFTLSSGRTDLIDFVDVRALGISPYITEVRWASATDLIVRVCNRTQTIEVLTRTDVSRMGPARIFNTQRSSSFIEFPESLPIDEWHFLEVRVLSGFRHLALFRSDGSTPEEPLRWLSGPASFDVMTVAGYDTASGEAYFVAATGDATERQLWRVRVDGSRRPEAVSPSGAFCSASFSPSGRRFVLANQGPDVPVYHLVQDGTSVVLESNSVLRATLQTYNLPTRSFTLIQGTAVPLHAWVLRPPGYDPQKKYPVVLYVYGGPQLTAQRATKRFMFGG